MTKKNGELYINMDELRETTFHRTKGHSENLHRPWWRGCSILSIYDRKAYGPDEIQSEIMNVYDEDFKTGLFMIFNEI